MYQPDLWVQKNLLTLNLFILPVSHGSVWWLVFLVDIILVIILEVDDWLILFNAGLD